MEDFISTIIWLTFSLLIVRCCIGISRRSFSGEGLAAQVLNVTVLAIAIVILGLTVLGAVGLLTPILALLLPVTIAFVAWLRVARRTSQHNLLNNDVDALSLPFIFWGAVGALLFGHSLVNGVFKFPTDWDTVMYHLPYIDHWLQTGSFATTESARWSNSANSEVLGLWFAVPFSGDFLVPFNNLPVMVVWVAATIELSRQLGMSGWWPHLAAAACIAVHATIHEIDDASNDLMVPAFFLASLHYAIRFRQSQMTSNLVLFGVCLGVLAGTKFFATGYALLSGLAFAGLCYGRMGLVRTMRASFTAIGISLLFGGYWYLRNFFMTGHVFYPSGSEDLHRRLPYPDLYQTTLAWNSDPRVSQLFLDAIWNICGPVHFAALIVLPTIPISMLFGTWEDRSKRKQIALMFFLLLISAALSIMTPLSVEDQPRTLNHLSWGYTPVRYSLCFLCLLILCAVGAVREIVQRLPSWVEKGVLGALTFAVMAQFGYRFWTAADIAHPDPVGYLDMPMAFAAGILTFLIASGVLLALRRRLLSLSTVAIATMLLSSLLVCLVGQRWHRNFASHYDAYYSTDYFTAHAAESNRMLILDERPYAFFGSHRQNYLLQPMVFDSVEETRSLMEEHQLSMVVTRIEEYKQLARFRPSWTALAADSLFEQTAKGAELRIFVLK